MRDARANADLILSLEVAICRPSREDLIAQHLLIAEELMSTGVFLDSKSFRILGRTHFKIPKVTRSRGWVAWEEWDGSM